MLFSFIKNLKEIVRPIRNIIHLKNNNFSVKFRFEGNLNIKFPIMGLSNLITRDGREFSQRCIDFSQRPTAEPLLRKIVYLLIQSGYVNPEKFIIDIGSWITDNTIIWAKLLGGGGGGICHRPI